MTGRLFSGRRSDEGSLIMVEFLFTCVRRIILFWLKEGFYEVKHFLWGSLIYLYLRNCFVNCRYKVLEKCLIQFWRVFLVSGKCDYYVRKSLSPFGCISHLARIK